MVRVGDPGGLAGWTGCFPGRPREPLQVPHHQARAPAPEEAVRERGEEAPWRGGGSPAWAPEPGKNSREGGTCCAWSPGEPPVGVSLHSAVPKVTNISLLLAAATLAISVFTGRLDRFGEQRGIPGRLSDGAQGSLCREELSQETETCRCGERSLNRNMLNSFLFIS